MKGISYYKTMNRLVTCILLFLFLFSTSPLSSVQASSSQGVVHAVLFYSPNCGHCHLVITETLPPLFEQYGEQLFIVGLDVSQPDGQVLFRAALQHFNLESGGVPFLVVGDTYLVGSLDIPEKFPGLIEQYLAQGGVGWPAIPGLAEATASALPTEVATPVEATPRAARGW
jgi:thiol-disulfide isomerase/thioredoxin